MESYGTSGGWYDRDTMPGPSRWGALVRASLVAPAVAAGCAAPPSPRPEAPASPAASPRPDDAAPVADEARAPAGPKATVGGPLWLLASGGRPPNETSAHVEPLRYGRGLFVHHVLARHERGRSVCPVLRPEGAGCAVFAISSTGQAPADGSWAGGETAGMPPPGEPTIAPRAWSSFAPGRDAVYALRGDAPLVDRIDERGSVKGGVIDASAATGWWLLRVAETGEGSSALLVRKPGSASLGADDDFFGSEGRGGVELGAAAIEPATRGRPARMGEVIPLGIGLVSGFHAKSARRVTSLGLKALWGSLAVVPVDDTKGTWAMVWHEVSPPSRGAPRDEALPSRGRRGKHGCGGPPSRPLTDASVAKRLHITRLRGASIERDDVVDAPTIASTPLIDVRPTPEGLEVNGMLYDPSGYKTRKLAPRVRGEGEGRQMRLKEQDNERVLGGGFDRASGEGLVVAWREGSMVAQRFDAGGAARGERVALAAPASPVERVFAARSGGEWALYRLDQGLSFVTGPLASAKPVAIDGRVVGLFPDGTGKLVVAVEADKGLRLTAFAPGAAGFGRAEPLADPEGWGGSGQLAWLSPRDGRPAMLVDAAQARSRPLTGGAAWSALEGHLPEALGSAGPVSVHPVDDDVVLLARGSTGAAATWLGAGKTVIVPGEAASRWPTEPWHAPLRGPLVGDALVLPDAPGEPVSVPSLEPFARRCPLAWPTGPRRVVMACEEPDSTDIAGLRATLRGVTFEPG